MRVIEVIFLTLLVFFASLHVGAKKVDATRAQLIADSWGEKKMAKVKKTNKEHKRFMVDGETSLHVFNFDDGGFVIVPSDDNTYPVLGYSTQGKIDTDKLPPHIQLWFEYYTDLINENKKLEKPQKTKDKWDEIESGISLKSVQSSVPSLFESTGSSRWATWNPYFSLAPATLHDSIPRGTNGCVPIAMSQIMKYFKYPLIGTGNISYTYPVSTNNQIAWVSINENLNSFFNYDLMPYQLTYCGKFNPNNPGLFNCNDGSWSNVPNLSLDMIDEVGKLQYLAGVSVMMNWIGMSDTNSFSGTEDTPNEWVDSMIEHFFYSSDAISWSDVQIANNKTGLKTDLRSSLNNGRPAILQYRKTNGGLHAIVIDGYENDEFFHFIEGQGGDMDAYYYLFAEDNDSVHLSRPNVNSLIDFNVTLNIHPDCPPMQDVTFLTFYLLRVMVNSSNLGITFRLAI
jgi:hypothetical protein